jgi:hypothetical protein
MVLDASINVKREDTVAGHVGIFWMIHEVVIGVSCPLAEAFLYGDCLTYEGGHGEQWDFWQTKDAAWLKANNFPIDILTSEYDDHPRGRVVKVPDTFVIYADRRLIRPRTIEAICERFQLPATNVQVKTDAHYRIAADWS